MLTEENQSNFSESAEPEAPIISQPRLNAAAAAVLRLRDERVLAAIQELLDQAASPDDPGPLPLLPPGYAAGEGFWMAPDFDEPMEDMMPYMY